MLLLKTYSGKDFYPFDLHDEMFDIEDIAHSLSLQCRYAGHCKEFYSVAQHSVYVSWMVKENNKLSALMHDAAEAYLSDIPTPIKSSLPSFKKLEDDVMNCISRIWNFKWPEPREVKNADQSILFWEMHHLFPHMKIDKEYIDISIDFEIWDPKKAKAEFLKHFNGLRDCI